jgi:hypothetical protein
MPRYEVDFSENNSGGSWWLDGKDYTALYLAGWKSDEDSRYDGRPYRVTKRFTAPTERLAESMAIDEWERITGASAQEEGCNCCGQPYNFYTSQVNSDGSDEFSEAVREAREAGISNEDMIRMVIDGEV